MKSGLGASDSVGINFHALAEFCFKLKLCADGYLATDRCDFNFHSESLTLEFSYPCENSCLNLVAGAFRGIERLTNFDISDNEGINQRDLNATIRAVCNSPYLASLRLSNVNISDLDYVLTPLLETG